jgi:transposase
MPKGLVTMSASEIDRGELIRRVHEKRLTQAKAAALMGLSVRQVKRLCRLFKDDGLSGLASRKRGRPSNRRLAAELKGQVIALVRERYADFGPKLAHEKLVELHDIRVGRETVRKWLTEAGIWLTRGCAGPACASAAAPPSLPGGARADRRVRPRVVRGPRGPLDTAGLR